MVGSRTTTAALGLAVSLVASAALWWYFDAFVFFLLVPFVPFLFRGADSERPQPSARECPQCGFRTTDDEFEFCPRDGARLESAGDRR